MNGLSQEEIDARVAKAVALFKEGFNCSQSVVAAYADLEGFSQEQALKMSASFGGGIGRMRETCGAACGMFLLAGLKTGVTDGADRDGKAANYAFVQQLAEEFKQHNGALRCADLLNLPDNEPTVATPEARTTHYYKKRPCVKIVEEAARIWGEQLRKKDE
jgi:C_GCAxxG_C_C family probable redox protein